MRPSTYSSRTRSTSGSCSSPWSEFFSWPGGASLVYLISAACLLAGVGLVLAPGAGLEERIPERLTMVATVLIYTGSLLGIACLVCHWRRDHEDAVALSVLLALFVIAAAAPLDVLATQFPALVTILSGVTLAAAVLCVRVWTKRVGGPLPAPVALGGGLLVLGSVTAPTLIALGIAHIGRPDPQALLCWWQGAEAVTCLGLAVLWLGCLHAPLQSKWPRTSRIQSEHLRWILAVVVSAAAIGQTWVASYTACLGLELADVLLPIVLLALFVDSLSERRLALNLTQRLVFWCVVSVLPLLLIRAGSVDPLAAPLTHPALAAAIGAAGIGWAAWRARDEGLAIIAGGWLILAIAGWGAWAEQPDLHLTTAGGALVAMFAFSAALTRRPILALITALLITLGIAHIVHPPIHLIAVLYGGQVLALHLLFGARLPGFAIVSGAGFIALGLSGVIGGPVLGIEHSWLTALVSTTLMAPALLRQQTRTPALIPLAMPLAGHLASFMWYHPAWCAIGAAFILLGAGAWLSRKTARRVSESGP